MCKTIKQLVVFILLLNLSIALSQTKKQQNDTINTEVVNVIKPYTPKISDAFKIKETPSVDDAQTTNKKAVEYNIFSIPVASLFTPAKVKAALVDRAKKEKLFHNYASLGVGSFTTLLGEVYLNKVLSNTQRIGGYINYHASQGGVEDIALDDDFSDAKIAVNYSKNTRDLVWNIDANFRHEIYNWYGLPDNVFTENQIAQIDPEHTFFTFDVGNTLQFEDRFIKTVRARYRRFFDDIDSAENNLIASTDFSIPINRYNDLKANVGINYLDGTFEQSLNASQEIDYGNLIANITTTYAVEIDNLNLNLGASVAYLNDTASGDNDFFVYPKITATYKLVNDVLIAFAGVEGELIQNSYYGFANQNSFVSPTLTIQPTDQQYDAYIGLQGKLSNNTSYTVKAAYVSENDKALFTANPAVSNASQGFQFANSFTVVYDDVTTFSTLAELDISLNKKLNAVLKAEYFLYTTDIQDEAWNLPDIKASLFLDYQINNQWFAGANLFFIGERLEQNFNTGTLIDITTLERFFDVNAHIGYRINQRWSIYAKANNILNKDYERWLNFPVQNVQFLAGVSYKFDF